MITRRQCTCRVCCHGRAQWQRVPCRHSRQPARVTILFDAFGRPSDLRRGWGYSSLIEYGGRRILFDTGSNGREFRTQCEITWRSISKISISSLFRHRHNDHTAGLNHVLRENPKVTIYTPLEQAGFSSQTPPALMNLIRRYVESVPDELRYFGGNPPKVNRSESPWGSSANFVHVRETTEATCPGFTLFTTRSGDAGNEGNE